MSLLIESIKLIDGRFCNLFYHEQRIKRSLNTLCGIHDDFDLEKFLNDLTAPSKGLFKCRMLYDDLSKQVDFIPYQPRQIKSLKIIEHDNITYEFKYADRKKIDRLFELRNGCDDILIVKRGTLTDSSFSNIVFKSGSSWYTPWSALLKGTMRQNLLDSNRIVEEEIRLSDIKSFTAFKLINAMLEFDSPEIDVSNIVL